MKTMLKKNVRPLAWLLVLAVLSTAGAWALFGGLRAPVKADPGLPLAADTNPYSAEWLAQYHGLVDNRWTAEYEQALQASVKADADASAFMPQAGDVRMSNTGFAGSQTSFQIAVRPGDSRFAVAAASDGRATGVAVYTSSDGGQTWYVREVPLGTAACCNPSVVYGRDGTVYLSVLDTSPSVAYVLSSTDDGYTWGAPVAVPVGDRAWLAVDDGVLSPRLGALYLTYADVGAGGSLRIKGYQSNDGGQTWGSAFFIGEVPPSGGYQQAAMPTVGVDGTLYVGYQEYASITGGCAAGVANVVARSSDGGANWAYSHTTVVQGGACIAAQAGRGVFCINSTGAYFRSRSHPILATHPANPAIVYMLYAGGDLDSAYACASGNGYHSDTLFRKSTDGGATWSAPVRVNTPVADRDQYLPWLAVAPDGLLVAGWHDRRDDGLNFQHSWYQAYSTNEGATWTESAVGDMVSQPNTFIGDYAGIAAENSVMLGMWWDSRDTITGDPYTEPLVPPAAGTATPTVTGTVPTPTDTRTPPPTYTGTATPTPTISPTPTATRTPTLTRTPIGTDTPTVTGTPPTPTPTACGQGDYTITTSTGTLVAGTTDIGNHCDDCATLVILPFPLTLYDQTFTSANIGSNGSVQFNSASTAFTNACLPATAMDFAVQPYWEDLRTDSVNSGIFSTVTGSAPNRAFILEWRTTYFSGSGGANFAVTFHETGSAFEVEYEVVDQGTNSATIGVQRDTGSRFTQYVCNTVGTITPGLQLNYTLPACATPSPTLTVTGTPPTPTNTVSPTPTWTRTVPVSPTRTPTWTPTASATPDTSATPTATPDLSATPTATPNDTDTPTPTATSLPVFTAYLPVFTYNTP